MPPVSKAQNAAMHAAAEGKSTLGIPKNVGKEFTKDQAPGSVKKLPEKKKAKPKDKRTLGERLYGKKGEGPNEGRWDNG
jgi:hypothetical protein